jgi:Bacterial Ig-like domain
MWVRREPREFFLLDRCWNCGELRSVRVAAVALTLWACAGCDNPGIDEGAATLVLIETHPQGGAKGASIAGPLWMEFNESIARSSATDSAFKLVDAGGHEVFGTLAVDGNRVRFDPELPLNLAETYRAEVTREIRGYNGATLEAAVAWSFATSKGKLGSAQKIGTIDGHAGAFQMSVSIDEQARGWAVWLEDVATFSGQVKVPQPEALVVAEQSADRSSWRRSQRFEAPTVHATLAFTCLVWDRQHNGHLVWQERTASGDRIQFARFDGQKETWGAPQTVAQSSELAYPRCALDPRVGLQVVWLDKQPAKSVVRQRVFDVEQGQWLKPPALLLDGGKDNTILAVVALQRAGPQTRVFFAAEMLSTIFLRVATLEDGAVRDEKAVSELAPKVEELQLGANRSGATFLLWKDTHNLSTTSLWALSRGTDKEGWSSPHKIVEQPKASSVGQSQLSVDSAGDAFVSWREADTSGSDWNVFHASYRRAKKTWEAPTLFQSIGSSGYHASAVTAGRRPLIFAVSSLAAQDSVWYADRAAPAAAWSKPTELAKHGSGMVVFPADSAVSMQTGQLAAWWYERKRQTLTVGGVVLQYFNLELWGVLYQPQ